MGKENVENKEMLEMEQERRSLKRKKGDNLMWREMGLQVWKNIDWKFDES